LRLPYGARQPFAVSFCIMIKRFLLFLLVSAAAMAQSAPPEESLHYSVSWPTGLSLGEGEVTRRAVEGGTEYRMILEAAVPGFLIRDEFSSRVNAEGCSLEFTKESTHGTRKASEKSTFDLAAGVMTRQTLSRGGGKSETPISGCPRDALAYLFFLRRELGAGRLPGSETVYFGSQYKVSIVYSGVQKIQVGEAWLDVDRLTGSIKGQASEHSFEMYFGRDEKRTLVLAKVPFSLGTFSMSLVP
jgi:hypothetical protein